MNKETVIKPRTWIILGATSIIAEEFAKLAAQAGYSLLLVGRDKEQLGIIAADLGLRFHLPCEILIFDFSADLGEILSIFTDNPAEIDLIYRL